MFDFFLGLFSNDMGIDLGTSNTLVYVRNQGIVLREPSVVAIDSMTRQPLAIGEEAKRMIGRTPANIVPIRPLKNGVIADFEVTQAMIRYFIRKVHDRKSLLHPRVAIGVPSGITEVERRAVRDSAHQAGAREIYLIEEPMASAIGADLPISDPSANMIVDVGGGTTEVAVISMGGIVVSKSVDVAGDEMDDAITQYFRKRYNLLTGENTAEGVKIQIGSVFPLDEEKTMEVKGRDQVTGLPRTIVVTSEEIRQALLSSIKTIVDMIKSSLEETPAELAADLVDRGLVLAGGGALLRGFSELLSRETELSVHLAPEPLDCVVLGTGKFLEELDSIDSARKRMLLAK
ncbi:rod shape-determining protein [Elusimicrobiota bacterium]